MKEEFSDHPYISFETENNEVPPERYFVNFKNVKGLRLINDESGEKKEKKGFLGKVGGFFSGLGKDIKSGYKKVEEKVKKIEVKKGIQNTYDKSKQLAKDTGIFFSDKAKQIKVRKFKI